MADTQVRELANSARSLFPRVRNLLRQKTLTGFNTEKDRLLPDITEWKTKLTEAQGRNVDVEVVNLLNETSNELEGLVEEHSAELHKQINAQSQGASRFKMPRKMSRKYCKKTPCKKMGFTQRSSCRPYKNCFTRRRKESF